ncbi:MAG: glycosyltransferase family 2 protein [Halothiobacillus sp.]|nr:glycosyltransferase family 2 protein [Halothiobacillus sp.]
MSILKVMLVIPTRNGARDLERLLASLSTQTLKADVCVVDSSSSDATIDIARNHRALVHSIQVSEFSHGGTRQLMVDQHPGYEIYVFMTQDAYLADEHAIESILAPFADPSVGAVCGRQLPHLDANPLATHARLFNYPPESRVKSMDDVAELGIKTPFISNSFAAYRREALADVGGFPNHVILSEDMYVAARMLMKGWKVAYAGDACCRHSHNYTLLEEFRRYFDMGVFHAREPWIRERFGSAGGEGLRFVKSELRFLGWRRLHLWPGALLRNALKLAGFKLGLNEKWLPLELKQRMSMHKRFWDGVHAGGGGESISS